MIPAIDAIMLATSSSLAASILAKVTVTTAFALTATWFARRNRAAVRHTLLAAAFGVLLVLPIATIVAPPVRIALPAAAQSRSSSPLATAAPLSAAPARPNDGVAPVAPRPSALSPSALLLAGWLAGTALFLLPVAIGLWQLRSLRRSALPWPQGQSVAGKLARDAGIHRRVEVLLQDALPGPVTCGVLRPAIVLPQDAQTWDPDDLNRAIVHELEHVRRGDWLSHCVARAVCAAYWFHPLVWIAWRQFTLEAERACDDAVLARSDAAAYADQLVGLAQRLSSAAKSPLLAMANRADLSTRVRAVLDSRQRRGRAGTFSVALACAAAAVLVLTVSPLTVVVAADQEVATAVYFTANTMLVTVNVVASDRNGRTVEGLQANDFAVTEDGVPQTINIFEFQAAGPRSSLSSYYTLAYYTANHDAADTFRAIKITCKQDTVAKLDYRTGYYTRGSGAGSAVVNRPTAIDGTPPVLLFKKEAEYSDEARKAKYQGTVILDVDVDATGLVTNIRTRRALGLGLDEKAIEAVSQWRFKPAMKDGKPVPVQAQVDVNFHLL